MTLRNLKLSTTHLTSLSRPRLPSLCGFENVLFPDTALVLTFGFGEQRQTISIINS